MRRRASQAFGRVVEFSKARDACGLIRELSSDTPYGAQNVRETAAIELGKLGDPVAIPALSARVQDEPIPIARALVVRALRKIGDASAVPALRAALRDPYDVVVVIAIDALVDMHDTESGPYLNDLLSSNLDAVRIKAAKALGEFRDARAVPRLLEQVSDANSVCRATALDALAKIGDPMALKPLADARARTRRPFMKRRIRLAIEMIENVDELPRQTGERRGG